MKVVELFAGVGGFRIGLERVSRVFFNVVWSNQFEPSTKRQHASEVYVARFGGAGHVNEDIAKVPTACIPDHDMLCAGFPCQDYSVARTLSQAAGIEGKKVSCGGKSSVSYAKRGARLLRYCFWRMLTVCFCRPQSSVGVISPSYCKPFPTKGM